MSDVCPLGSCPTACAFLLHKESKCNAAIQVALVIIATVGIALFAASYYPFIPATVGYFGISFSVISLVALKIFRSYSSSELDRAIDACQSFSQMEAIMNKSQMTVSWLGVRQLDAKGITGTSTVDHMALRVEREIATHLQDEPVVTSDMATGKSFIYDSRDEEASGKNLVIHIWKLFKASEDTIDKGNVFTQIYYWTPRFFKAIICYNDIRNRYNGNCNGMLGTIGGFSNNRSGNDEMPPKWGFID